MPYPTLFFQGDIKSWGDLLREYGLPVVVAGLLFLLIWKVLIPTIARQNERMIQMLETQLEEARKARSDEVSKFNHTMDTVLEKHTEAMRLQTEAIRTAISEMKETRRAK